MEAIEVLYADRLADQVERLAHHAIRGERWGKAVTYLHQAGTKAVAHYAYQEAVEYFEQALTALERRPDSRETLELGIAIRIALGPALSSAKGWKAPEVEQTYIRARELCQQLGESPQLFPVLWRLSKLYNFRGEIQAARELGEQLFTLARREQDPALLLEAHHTLWGYSLSLGELASAREHYERGLALYDPQQHRHHASQFGGHDPGVCGLSGVAKVLWLQGYPDQALQRTKDSLALAHELSHPISLLFALAHSAFVYQQCRDVQALREAVEAGLTLAAEVGRTMIWALTVQRGWLLAEQGNEEEGIALILKGRANTMEQGYNNASAFLAEAYVKAGQPEKGLKDVAETLARVHKTGMSVYEEELHRIKGELLLRQAVPADRDAETCFRHAIDMSHRRNAKSLELRAAMSLSRLWQKQGKKDEARRMLAEIYGWFTEGFDTADLKEAKALLEELS